MAADCSMSATSRFVPEATVRTAPKTPFEVTPHSGHAQKSNLDQIENEGAFERRVRADVRRQHRSVIARFAGDYHATKISA